MDIVLLDTETTGVSEEDRICQLSFIVADEEGNIKEVHNRLTKPPVPIKFDAMAIHHITPEMVENEQFVQDTKEFERLKELNTEDNVMVIHNAKFDIEMLFREDFEVNMKVIDTFRCIKHIFPDGRHGLQYNRYALGLYKKEKLLEEKYNLKIQPHDALSDVVVLKLLLDYLLEQRSIEELIQLTQEPILYDKFYNGKYKREYIKDIVLKDPEYIDFLLSREDLEFDLRYSINYYKEQLKDQIEYKFSIGKYQGKTPGEVYEIDPQYLKWAYNNMSMSHGLRESISKYI